MYEMAFGMCSSVHRDRPAELDVDEPAPPLERQAVPRETNKPTNKETNNQPTKQRNKQRFLEQMHSTPLPGGDSGAGAGSMRSKKWLATSAMPSAPSPSPGLPGPGPPGPWTLCLSVRQTNNSTCLAGQHGVQNNGGGLEGEREGPGPGRAARIGPRGPCLRAHRGAPRVSPRMVYITRPSQRVSSESRESYQHLLDARAPRLAPRPMQAGPSPPPLGVSGAAPRFLTT